MSGVTVVKPPRGSAPGQGGYGGVAKDVRFVYVDGIFYGADREFAELVRTAHRWKKSEHGDFLVLR